MNIKSELKRYPLSVIPILLCILVYTLTSNINPGQAGTQKKSPDDNERRKVAILMSNAIKEREKITSEGIKLWVPLPLPQEALEDVKEYGDKAILILAEYVKSGAYHERELAMQFLAHIGGVRIVEPLLIVIRYDPEPILREEALT